MVVLLDVDIIGLLAPGVEPDGAPFPGRLDMMWSTGQETIDLLQVRLGEYNAAGGVVHLAMASGAAYLPTSADAFWTSSPPAKAGNVLNLACATSRRMEAKTGRDETIAYAQSRKAQID